MTTTHRNRPQVAAMRAAHLSKRKRTVLAALSIAKDMISKELWNPSEETIDMVKTFDVDQNAVEEELRNIIDYLARREMRNKAVASESPDAAGEGGV